MEQINLDGPALAADLDSFEPNQDGTKIAVCSSKGAVRVISLNSEGNSGQVIVLEKPLPDSVEVSRTGSFGCAPRWRNAHELTFPVRNLENATNHASHALDERARVLQELQYLATG